MSNKSAQHEAYAEIQELTTFLLLIAHVSSRFEMDVQNHWSCRGLSPGNSSIEIDSPNTCIKSKP